MTEGDQGVSCKSSVSRLNCLQVTCSKDFNTDTSQETFNTVKKKKNSKLLYHQSIFNLFYDFEFRIKVILFTGDYFISS